MTASLFDYMARSTDPDTSKAAANEDRSTLELDVLSAVRAAGWVGANTDDVWHALGGKARPNSVARRLTSLAKDGRIELCGTKPGDSGRQQNVWRVPTYLTDGAA